MVTSLARRIVQTVTDNKTMKSRTSKSLTKEEIPPPPQKKKNKQIKN